MACFGGTLDRARDLICQGLHGYRVRGIGLTFSDGASDSQRVRKDRGLSRHVVRANSAHSVTEERNQLGTGWLFIRQLPSDHLGDTICLGLSSHGIIYGKQVVDDQNISSDTMNVGWVVRQLAM